MLIELVVRTFVLGLGRGSLNDFGLTRSGGRHGYGFCLNCRGQPIKVALGAIQRILALLQYTNQ